MSVRLLSHIWYRLIVPVSKSRNIPEVILVRRWAVGVLGIWRGGVGRVKGGAKRGQFTSNLRLRWTIPVTAGGCQVSRRGHKGGAKGN
jgi:hypothetical protein